MDLSANRIDCSGSEFVFGLPNIPKFGEYLYNGFGFGGEHPVPKTPAKANRKMFKHMDDYEEPFNKHHYTPRPRPINSPFNHNSLNDPIINFDLSGCKQPNFDSSSNLSYTCDVVFSFDTTGSMRNVIRSVRNNLVETVDRLFKEINGIRIGIIVHGDYCDNNGFFWKMDLNSDIDKIKQFILDGPDTGGGDSEECYELVLHEANTMDWKSEVKVLVVIGDEIPHEKGYNMPRLYKGFQSKLHIDWKIETERLLKNKITVFSCHANPDSNTHAIPFYHHISNTTKGYYFPLNELQSFNHYMVTICMRAADAAEDLKLLREQQDELNKKIESGQYTQKEKELFRMESTHIDEAIYSSNKEGIFSPDTAFNTRSKSIRTIKKAKSKTEDYINELNTTLPCFRSTSTTTFMNTINTYNIDVAKSSSESSTNPNNKVNNDSW